MYTLLSNKQLELAVVVNADTVGLSDLAFEQGWRVIETSSSKYQLERIVTRNELIEEDVFNNILHEGIDSKEFYVKVEPKVFAFEIY